MPCLLGNSREQYAKLPQRFILAYYEKVTTKVFAIKPHEIMWVKEIKSIIILGQKYIVSMANDREL